MSLIGFQQEIEARTRRKLKIKINNNRQTMLSVRWESDCTRVSLHRMFLQAPQNVMDELACYIQKKHKVIAPSVKAFIEESMRKLDYSHTIKPSQLMTQGAVYNLKKLYNDVNREYFDNAVDLYITWYGKPHLTTKSRITYGLYFEPQRLIKIARFLDHLTVPDYVISFVIYHEMLHHVCPTYVDDKGVHRSHDKAFKDREKQFRYFDLAMDWMSQYEHAYFGY
jgi:hypothetical protein